MIEIKDVITLNHEKKYIVISKIKYETKIYYLLIDAEESNEVIIVVEKEEKILNLVNNKDLILKLIPLFITETSKYLTNTERKEIVKLLKIFKKSINIDLKK